MTAAVAVLWVALVAWALVQVAHARAVLREGERWAALQSPPGDGVWWDEFFADLRDETP